MGSIVKVQTNFTVGEVNPELRGRIDLQQYESALERARNVLINPRGIVGRRDGLKFVALPLPLQVFGVFHFSFRLPRPICSFFLERERIFSAKEL